MRPFLKKELAETHNYSIIKLLFKKNNREELKNYRPISLANIDYKLLANVLVSRLHTVIGKLVSPEQTAYIRGRYIGENVRLLLDVIEYTKEKQKKKDIYIYLVGNSRNCSKNIIVLTLELFSHLSK